LQALKHLSQGLRAELTKTLHESFLIDRSYLIERDKSRAALKPTADTPRIGVAARRHRRDYDSTQVLVQFVWRNDNARPRFLDFSAQRWIQPDEMNLASPHYQRHSTSSNFVGVDSSSN